MRRAPVLTLIVVVVALLGVSSASAQAAPTFQAGAYPATIHGSSALGNEDLKLEGGSAECATSFHAEAKEASTTLALAPSFSSCKAFGYLNATITPNGCRYLLHATEQSALDKYKASFDIACEAGKAIKVVAGVCEVEVPAQSGLASVELVNDTEASPKQDITVDLVVSAISYKVLKDGIGCPFGGTGAKTGGSLNTNSPITLTGQSPGSPEEKIAVGVG